MKKFIIKIFFHNLLSNAGMPFVLIFLSLFAFVGALRICPEPFRIIVRIIFNIIPLLIVVYAIYGIIRLILIIDENIEKDDSVIDYFKEKKWKVKNGKPL